MQEKTIRERRKGGVFGQLVRSADTRAQRALQLGASPPEHSLVEHAEQRVENRGRTKEHLVEKRDVGFGQHALRLGFHHALAQLLKVDGSKDLRRLRETTHEVLEVSSAQFRSDPPDRFTLGGAGRPDQKDVLARDGCENHELNGDLALHQALAGPVDNGAEALCGGGDRCGHESRGVIRARSRVFNPICRFIVGLGWLRWLESRARALLR